MENNELYDANNFRVLQIHDQFQHGSARFCTTAMAKMQGGVELQWIFLKSTVH